MRRDLIIGLLASALFHGGAFYGEKLFTQHAVAKSKVTAKKVVEVMEMPKIDEEEPEVNNEPSDVQASVVEFAPPMQADMPSTVTVDSFVQVMQPPPPEGAKPNPGALTIPANRAGMGQTKLTNVFNLADLDQKPQEKYRPGPQYPFEMRRAGIEGDVLVGFIVNVNGDTQDVYAVRSSQREFEAAAIQAVQKWKFRPGKRKGQTVNTRMQVPIVFNITED
jgi:protein TonB